MAKKKSVFVCQRCTYKSPRWMGKCPECMEWNTLIEEFPSDFEGGALKGRSRKNASGKESVPTLIGEVEARRQDRVLSGISEFDRVVGGGLVEGSVLLIGGEPGIGKSTLLMELSGKLSNQKDTRVLYVSGEESQAQVAERSKRLGVNSSSLYVYHESTWQDILEQMKKLRPQYIVLDSIQTTVSLDIQSAPGTVSQIREVTYELVNYAKANGITAFIIGHVTKDGNIAGPKILEHMVDVVVYFEGDQYGYYRLLRVIKNRFGNVNEVGIFEMAEQGLQEVKNPSQYFLDLSLDAAYGRSQTCIVEGSRSLFVEIQALVVDNKYGNGRRTTQGLDNNRLALLVAVIEKYFGIPLGFTDVYVNVVGGIKLTTRESDLSILGSILSSFRASSIKNDTVLIGEVGLTGEVRAVPRMEMRLKEMLQMNYKRVITSYQTAETFKGKFKNLEIIGIRKAQEILDLVF